MPRKTLSTAILASLWLVTSTPPAAGQSAPSKPAEVPGRRTRADRQIPARTAQERIQQRESATGNRSPAAPGPEAAGAAEGAGSAEAAAGRPASLAGRLRTFVKESYLWILGFLLAGVLAAVGWITLTARAKGRGEPFLEPLDDELGSSRRESSKAKRYSSTRIRVSDVDARLRGNVTAESVETDREYALVVETDALKQPEVDESTGRTFADETAIRACLERNDFEGAYRAYLDRIEQDGSLEFHADVEKALSEHFLRGRDFEKAARVLEHHVATRSAEAIDPETYFNLGYTHFQTRTVNKSRRFFKLFIDASPRPEHKARAQRILEHLGEGAVQN